MAIISQHKTGIIIAIIIIIIIIIISLTISQSMAIIRQHKTGLSSLLPFCSSHPLLVLHPCDHHHTMIVITAIIITIITMRMIMKIKTILESAAHSPLP